MNTAASILIRPDGLWVGTSEGLIVRLSDDGSAWAMRVAVSGPVQALAISDDGALLLAGDGGGAVAVLRIADRTVADAFRCAHPLVQGAVLGPHAYVTVDQRRQGLIWSLDTASQMVAAPICSDGIVPVPFDAFGVAADGVRLTLLSALEWVIWDRASNRVVAAHRPIDGMQLAYLDGLVGLNEGGDRYFIHWDEHLVFDTQSEALVFEGAIRHRASCAALSPDGRRLAVGGQAGTVSVTEPTGAATVSVQLTDMPIARVAWAPAGDRLAWIDAQGGFGVIEASGGRQEMDRNAALDRLQKAAVMAWPP